MTIALLLSCSMTLRAEDSAPEYQRIRAALERDASAPLFESKEASEGTKAVSRVDKVDAKGAATASPRRQFIRKQRDSLWNGVLLGAAAGAGGGYVWAQNICGSNDRECFYIAGPVGVLTGAGIGAAVGAIVDALHR